MVAGRHIPHSTHAADMVATFSNENRWQLAALLVTSVLSQQALV